MSSSFGEESSQLDVAVQSAAPQLAALSIEEESFTRSQVTSPQRPSSTELPASLALPLSRTRSSTYPNTPTSLRAGPSISVDDDNASIRSFVPTFAAGDDLEAMLSEMLDSDARWRMEHDDDIDVWEGQSEDDTDSDLDDEESGDDGILLWENVVDGRGQDDPMEVKTETFFCVEFGREADLFSIWR